MYAPSCPIWKIRWQRLKTCVNAQPNWLALASVRTCRPQPRFATSYSMANKNQPNPKPAKRLSKQIRMLPINRQNLFPLMLTAQPINSPRQIRAQQINLLIGLIMMPLVMQPRIRILPRRRSMGQPAARATKKHLPLLLRGAPKIKNPIAAQMILNSLSKTKEINHASLDLDVNCFCRSGCFGVGAARPSGQCHYQCASLAD